MICKLARYQIRPGTEPEVLEAVREFVSAVRDAEPCTTYRAYQLDDRLSFVH
jgi:quinol monooxygenase YgiN